MQSLALRAVGCLAQPRPLQAPCATTGKGSISSSSALMTMIAMIGLGVRAGAVASRRFVDLRRRRQKKIELKNIPKFGRNHVARGSSGDFPQEEVTDFQMIVFPFGVWVIGFAQRRV